MSEERKVVQIVLQTVADLRAAEQYRNTLQGSTNTAIVVTNNLVLNTLTISPALTWTNGQGVALAYGGAAPDMGAFESGVFGSPAPDPEPEPQSPTGRITSGSVRIIGGSWGVKP